MLVKINDLSLFSNRVVVVPACPHLRDSPIGRHVSPALCVTIPSPHTHTHTLNFADQKIIHLFRELMSVINDR